MIQYLAKVLVLDFPKAAVIGFFLSGLYYFLYLFYLHPKAPAGY